MFRKHLRLPEVTTQPPVEHIKRRLRLVVWDHVATSVELQEGKVAAGLDLTNSLAIAIELEVLHLGLVVGLGTRPLKRLSPSLVTEPVADVVSITSVDEYRDLLEDTRDNAVEGLHPVALKKEVAVDIKVAGLVVGDLSTDSLHNLLVIEVCLYPVKLIVAERVAATWLADIVDVLASALVGTDHGIVAVDGSGYTRPNGLGIVAVLNEASATGVGIVHGLALRLVEHSGPATLTAGHGTVVLVLSKTVGQTVSDENRLEVDVAVLVGQNLRGKDGDVVTSVRLARDVEALVGVLGELLEEEGEQGVDVLAGSDSIAH